MSPRHKRLKTTQQPEECTVEEGLESWLSQSSCFSELLMRLARIARALPALPSPGQDRGTASDRLKSLKMLERVIRCLTWSTASDPISPKARETRSTPKQVKRLRTSGLTNQKLNCSLQQQPLVMSPASSSGSQACSSQASELSDFSMHPGSPHSLLQQYRQRYSIAIKGSISLLLLFLLLSSLTTVYSTVETDFPYTSGISVVLPGNKHISLSNLRHYVVYNGIVECPDTNNFLDAVNKNPSYRCDHGTGEPLAKGPDMYESCKDWGGWTPEQKAEMKPEHYYQCKTARDGRTFMCLYADIVHCIHMYPREHLTHMTMATRVASKTVININGQDKTLPTRINDVDIDVHVDDHWPNHAVVWQGKIYYEESLKASQYIASSCPVYREIRENATWQLNHMNIEADYIEGKEWTIRSKWFGLPSGKTMEVKRTNNDYYVNYEVSTATLVTTSPKRVAMVPSETVADDCEIVACNSVSDISDQVKVDGLTGVPGRMISVLTRHKTKTHCRISDNEGAVHVIDANKKHIVVTMATTVSSLLGKQDCPPPTDAQYDRFYGYDVQTTAFEATPAGFSMEKLLAGLNIPFNFQKYILLGAALFIAVQTGFNQVGVIAAAAIALVAMSQGADAAVVVDVLPNVFSTTSFFSVIDYLVILEEFMTPFAYLSTNPVIPILCVALCALLIGRRSEDQRVICCLNMALLAMFYNTSASCLFAVISWMIVRIGRNDEVRLSLTSIIDVMNDEMNKATASAYPWIKPKVISHSLMGKRAYITPFDVDEDKEEIPITIISDKRLVVSAPFSRLRKQVKLYHSTRKGAKGLLIYGILYPEEYSVLRNCLFKMDEASLLNVYAGAIRQHGREPWELNSFLSRVRSKTLRQEMHRSIVNTYF